MAFRRRFNLVLAPLGPNSQFVQGINVSKLRCKFAVKKTIIGSPPKPNHAVIEVFNLSSLSASFVSSTPAIAVSLDAGYADEGTQRIYLGEVRTGDTRQEGTEQITKLDTDDKGRKFIQPLVNTGVAVGTPVIDAIRTLLNAFNATGGAFGYSTIGEGNLQFAMNELKQRGITSLHPNGGLFSGYVVDELTDLCRGANLEWSIQDGSLFIRQVGAPMGTSVLSLSGSSGLIGSPAIDNEGRLTAEALMLPGIVVGAVINFNSKYINNVAYRITECTYRGDTHGTDWHVQMKGTRY
jgi:hypothetical protein